MNNETRNATLGCLSVIITFTILFWIIKGSFLLLKEFWWLIVGILFLMIVSYYGKLIYNLIYTKKMNLTDSNYEAPMGEVYKVCPHCNAQVKVTETTCPRCKRALN